jgi:hypothetical protein
MNDPLVDKIVDKMYGDEPEKQYLGCRNCGEVFDSITAAHEHGTADLSGSAGWCGDEGFNIIPESEAF